MVCSCLSWRYVDTYIHRLGWWQDLGPGQEKDTIKHPPHVEAFFLPHWSPPKFLSGETWSPELPDGVSSSPRGIALCVIQRLLVSGIPLNGANRVGTGRGSSIERARSLGRQQSWLCKFIANQNLFWNFLESLISHSDLSCLWASVLRGSRSTVSRSDIPERRLPRNGDVIYLYPRVWLEIVTKISWSLNTDVSLSLGLQAYHGIFCPARRAGRTMSSWLRNPPSVTVAARTLIAPDGFPCNLPGIPRPCHGYTGFHMCFKRPRIVSWPLLFPSLFGPRTDTVSAYQNTYTPMKSSE